MYKFCVQYQNLINSFDVICLVETWIYKPEFNIPIFLQNYDCVVSLADKKPNSRGRASGGLIIFIKKSLNIKFELLEKSNINITLKLKVNSVDNYVISLYY